MSVATKPAIAIICIATMCKALWNKYGIVKTQLPQIHCLIVTPD